MSRGSGFSTASAVEFRKSANCRGSPIARNYHSKINRSKEAKRIDEENLVSCHTITLDIFSKIN